MSEFTLNTSGAEPAPDEGWRPSREEIARAVDPWAMDFSGYNDFANFKRELALAAADRVLALFPLAKER